MASLEKLFDNDWKNVIILFFLVIISHISFCFLYLFDKNYWFLTKSLPYFLRADSFYYAKILVHSDLFNILFALLLTAGSSYYLYFFGRNIGISKINSFLLACLILFYPSFFLQTRFGYIDTPIIIFFGIIQILYGLSINKMGYSFFRFFHCITGIICLYMWNSGIPLLFLIGICLWFSIFIKKKYHFLVSIIGMFGLIFFLLYFLSFLNKIFYLKSLGVSEYYYTIFPIYYLLFAIVIYLFIKHFNKLNWRIIFLGLISFVLFCFSIFFNRIAAFTIIFVVPLYIRLLKKHKVSKVMTSAYLIAFLIFFVVWTLMVGLVEKPLMNREFENVISNIPLGGEVINFWDNGHFINYFGGITRFHSQPKKKDIELFAKGLLYDEELGTSFLDTMNYSSDYFVLFEKKDFDKIKYVTEHDSFDNNSLFYKSLYILENKVVWNQNLDYFNIVSYGKFGNNSYVLLRRNIYK